MGKYIDAEEFEYTILHEDVEIAEHRCKDYESYINGANQFRYQVKNAIRKAPAADVVPRAELAREIFAEIEKNSKFTIQLVESMEFDSEEIRKAKLECYRDCLGYFQKLKKKYTGGSE